MTARRIETLLGQLLLIGLATLAPCVAHAGLTGDTVTASLHDDLSGTDIFNGSAPVTALPEFTGIFILREDPSTWTLDLTDTGFTLTGVCSDAVFNSCAFPLLVLSISDLDFTPPANLVGLTGFGGFLFLAGKAGTPQITSSSVTIEFQDVQLSSGFPTTQTYEATFVTQVPLPAAAVLLVVGALPLSRWVNRRGRV